MPTAAGQSLLDAFDRIRIINLAHRDDRRREMAQELTRLGLTVDGAHIAFHAACKPDDAGDFPSIGARGCFMSHLTVLREALAAGSERLLILEDDVDFSGDAPARLGPTLARLAETDWAIFYGGYEEYHGPTGEDALSPAVPGQPIRTTHFLAFRRPAIEAIIPYFEAMLGRSPGDATGGPMHVDGAYSWFRQAHPGLPTMLAVPVLGSQRPSRTDIHPPGLIDRTAGLRTLADLARRAKRALGRRTH